MLPRQYGEIGYAAYYIAADGKTFDGRPMPAPDSIDEAPAGARTMALQEAAAMAVRRAAIAEMMLSQIAPGETLPGEQLRALGLDMVRRSRDGATYSIGTGPYLLLDNIVRMLALGPVREIKIAQFTPAIPLGAFEDRALSDYIEQVAAAADAATDPAYARELRALCAAAETERDRRTFERPEPPTEAPGAAGESNTYASAATTAASGVPRMPG